jgi:hypothetical protein
MKDMEELKQKKNGIRSAYGWTSVIMATLWVLGFIVLGTQDSWFGSKNNDVFVAIMYSAILITMIVLFWTTPKTQPM